MNVANNRLYAQSMWAIYGGRPDLAGIYLQVPESLDVTLFLEQ